MSPRALVAASAGSVAVALAAAGCFALDWDYRESSPTSSSTGASTGGGHPECMTSRDCPIAAACTVAACADGRCTSDPAPTGEACGVGKVCDAKQACVAGGASVWADDFEDATAGNVAVTSKGDIYVTGFLLGTTKFSSSVSLDPGSGVDGFVAKLDAGGAPRAAALLGHADTQSIFVNGLAVRDDESQIAISGDHQTSGDFLGCTTATGDASFVLALDDAFHCSWLLDFTPSQNGSVTIGNVANLPGGDVVVAGRFSTEVTVANAAAPEQSKTHDVTGNAIFAARIHEGDVVWFRSFTGSAFDPSREVTVAVDPSGQIFLAGTFEGALDLADTLDQPAADGATAFLARLDPNGTPVWDLKLGGPAQLEAFYSTSVAADPFGNVGIVGTVSAAVDFGDGKPIGPGAFAAVYQGDVGKLVYRTVLATDGADPIGLAPYAIAFDASGDLALTGRLTGTLDLATGKVAGAGRDIFIGKLDRAGKLLWAKVFGDANTSDTSEGLGLAGDASGNLLATGILNGSADFGAGLVDNASQGTFVVELGP